MVSVKVESVEDDELRGDQTQAREHVKWRNKVWSERVQ